MAGVIVMTSETTMVLSLYNHADTKEIGSHTAKILYGHRGTLGIHAANSSAFGESYGH